MKSFGASRKWSWTVKQTVLTLAICLAGLYFCFSLKTSAVAWMTAVGVVFCGEIISLFFLVRGYTVTEDAILVRRPFWSTRIPREGLVSAAVEPGAMQGSQNTCGYTGAGSSCGWFWGRKWRHFRAYVTDEGLTVVLRWEKRTVVISPDDPEGFVREALG